MPQSLTFHFSKKKEQVYKNLFAKGHTRQSNTLLFDFHFVPPSFSTFLYSPLSLPSLSPSPVRLPPQHFSSDKQSLSCFPKQLQRAAISLSHLIWVFAFFPEKRRRIMARVDSEPWNNNSRKQVWQVVVPTCFHRSQIFWEYLVHKFVSGLWVYLGHIKRDSWIWLSSDGSPSVSSSWNASCSCLFYKPAAENPDRDHKKNPLRFIFRCYIFCRRLLLVRCCSYINIWYLLYIIYST